MNIDGARMDIRRLSLAELISIAYEVKGYQVVGPDRIKTQRFDISATLPAGASETQLPSMLMALLEERFQLKAHAENREYPIYALIIAKNSASLTPSDSLLPDSTPKIRTSIDAHDVKHVEFSKITIAELAKFLEPYADRPIVDKTNLQGTYHVALDISLQDLRRRAGFRPPVSGDNPADSASEPPENSVFVAVQHLGLKLQATKEQLRTIVVDRVERKPISDN